MDIKFAIVTCSDTRTIEQDEAGSALVGLIEGAGWHVVSHVVACDDARDISDAIRAATDELGADIVLTCGGTGLSARDVTPEATAVVCERDVPGIAEAIRAYSRPRPWSASVTCPASPRRSARIRLQRPVVPCSRALVACTSPRRSARIRLQRPVVPCSRALVACSAWCAARMDRSPAAWRSLSISLAPPRPRGNVGRPCPTNSSTPGRWRPVVGINPLFSVASFTGRLSHVINFPGSTNAARECWEAVSHKLEHAMKMAAGGGH